MIILYPTETVYGLGVDALDHGALRALFELKGRDAARAASWLVTDIEVIERYAVMDEWARRLAETFLPGPLTLILRARDTVPREVLPADRTIGFRVSSDPHAAALVRESMGPLTCTSANVSGEPTLRTPEEILAQFEEKAQMIDRVIDDGPREGDPSTTVRVVDGKYEIFREGAIPEADIVRVLS